MELALDFSGLNNISQKQPRNSPTEDFLPEGTLPTKTEKSPQEAPETPKTATIKLQREKELNNRAAAVYKEYQNNIKRSGQIQAEIVKGIQAGEAPETLLLKAVKAIALMTNDNVLYSQVERDIAAIWGAGLLKPTPIKEELAAVKQRLTSLEEAELWETEADSQKRIQRAIEAHRARAAELEKLLDK